jgi:hypothetical protein
MGDLLFSVVFDIIFALILGAFFAVVAWIGVRFMTKENPSILRVYLVSFLGALLFFQAVIRLMSFILLVTGFWIHGSAVVFVFAYISPYLVLLFFFLVLLKFLCDLKWSQALIVAVLLTVLSIPFFMLTWLLITPLVPILWVIKSWPTP